jgi:hypothetical protein
MDSSLAMDRSVLLTIPKELDRYEPIKAASKSRDVRIRPGSARPETKNYRSLVSQNRLKHYCPFCEQKIDPDNCFEYTIKSVIELIEFYQENAESDDIQLSEEINNIKLPMKIKALRVNKSSRLTSKRSSSLKTVPLPIRLLYPGMHYSTYEIKVRLLMFNIYKYLI